MAETIKFEKVTSAPVVYTPNTLYLLTKNGGLEILMSDAEGNAAFSTVGQSVSQSSLPSIDGPTTVYAGIEVKYEITNYDSRFTYELSNVVGSAVQEGKYVFYTPPLTAGPASFKLNDSIFSVTVINSFIVKPTVIFPEDYSNGIPPNPIVLSSDFSTSGITDTHRASTWQISTDSSFRVIIAQVTESSSNLVSWPVFDLEPGTKYYVRLKHHGNNIFASEWSDAVQFTTIIHGYPVDETAILYDVTPVAGEQFGKSVAISGNGLIMAVGCPYATYGGVANKGSVSIFKQDNGSWVNEATLSWSLATASTQFGHAVALSYDGSYLVVGAPAYLTNTGRVIVFNRSSAGTWNEVNSYAPATIATSSYFGYSVDIDRDGTRFIAGMYGYSSARGRANIFYRTDTTFKEEAQLSSSDLATTDWLGYAVSISGDGSKAIVCARYEDPTIGTNAGSAYPFFRSGTTWTQGVKFTPSTGMANMYFGSSCKLSGDGNRVVIGATNTTVGSVTVAGTAYVFKWNGATSYEQEAIFTPLEPVTNGMFGFSVGIDDDGDFILIGQPEHSAASSTNSGKVQLHTCVNNVWDSGRIIEPSIYKQTKDYYGYSVALSDGAYVGVIGAYNANRLSYSTAGCVHVFT